MRYQIARTQAMMNVGDRICEQRTCISSQNSDIFPRRCRVRTISTVRMQASWISLVTQTLHQLRLRRTEENVPIHTMAVTQTGI